MLDTQANLFRNKLRCAAALSEVQPPFVVVVPLAAQLDVIDGRLATQDVRIDVMEFQETSLVAAVAAVTDEGATSKVPNPDNPLHLGGRSARARPSPAGWPWTARAGELLLGQIHQQCRQRPVQDRGVVAGRNGVAEHVLRQAQLLERPTTDGDL